MLNCVVLHIGLGLKHYSSTFIWNIPVELISLLPRSSIVQQFSCLMSTNLSLWCDILIVAKIKHTARPFICKKLTTKKFFGKSPTPLLGRLNSFLQSGQARLSPGCLFLLHVSIHLRQNVCPHGSTRGSVYSSVQIGHSVMSSNWFVVAISFCTLNTGCQPAIAKVHYSQGPL